MNREELKFEFVVFDVKFFYYVILFFWFEDDKFFWVVVFVLRVFGDMCFGKYLEWRDFEIM